MIQNYFVNLFVFTVTSMLQLTYLKAKVAQVRTGIFPLAIEVGRSKKCV